MTTATRPEILSSDEVADRLGVPVETVRFWRHQWLIEPLAARSTHSALPQPRSERSGNGSGIE